MPKLRVAEIVRKYEQELLNDWVREQMNVVSQQRVRLTEDELRAQCKEFLGLFLSALQFEKVFTPESSDWAPIRDFLGNLSASRGKQGFSPSETAMFVF